MKKGRLPSQSRPPSPWRWAIGGPITDFGEDGIDAGPSRSSSYAAYAAEPWAHEDACMECAAVTRRRRRSSQSSHDEAAASLMELAELEPSDSSQTRHSPRLPPPIPPPTRASHPSSRRRRWTAAATLLLAAAAAPFAAAGPISPTPTPTPTSVAASTNDILPSPTAAPLLPRRLEPDPNYVYPTSFPSISTVTVPERILPLYLTQADDGQWYHVENAWWLYGRVIVSAKVDAVLTAQEPRDTPPPTATTAQPLSQYHVVSVLPRGWGVVSNRGNLYQTSFIVTAAVILAVAIVAGIIFITIQRRKVARRKRRHNARMRRKALAAVGLTEDEVRNAGSDTERAFKERLDEFERQHQAKRRAKQKNHQVTFVRTKVRVWHKGMRKRKGAANVEDEKTATTYSSAHVLGGRPASPASSFTASHTSLASTRPSSRASGSSRSHPGATPTQEPDHSSDQTPETLVNSDLPSSPTSYTSKAPSNPHSHPSQSQQSQPSSSLQDPSSPESQAQSDASEPAHYPNLPPAYRPASVHSARGEASGSSQTATRSVATAAEKVAASGFYPAPTTAEAEAAQAIAHRADAKAPIIVPPEENERHHVATDDKRELERLRLGGSAPPVARQTDDAGPSAPRFEVDEAGFEIPEAIPEEEPTTVDTSPSSSSNVSTGIPLPPAPLRLRSLLTGFDTVGPGSAPLSPLESPTAAPSAPPLDSPMESPSAPPAPSAPLLLTAPSAPPLPAPSAPPAEPSAPPSPHPSVPPDDIPSLPAPSAPPLDDDDETTHDEDEDEGPTPTTSPDDGSDTDAGDMRANLGVSGHGFLPRYEP